MANSTTTVSLDKKDYISHLPKEIIHDHILSKLDTWESAQISVLSKTWKSLWSSFPCLEFYPFHFHQTRGFKEFVDQTLRGRQKTKSDILKFKLYITHGIETSDIDKWVSLVMERNIKEFHLRILGGKPYTWPPQNMCIAMTITVLELCHCDVKFCSIIKLPHLQILSLENVFLDDRSIGIFISGCPSMNDLKLWYCYGLKHLSVANHHQLKKAHVGYCFGLEKVDIIQVSSLQTLTLYFTESFTRLYPSVFTIDSITSEMLRELHLCNYSREDRALQNLLCGLSNLECLILESVRQQSQNIRISSRKLKRLVLEHCEFLMFDISAPNLTSLKYENNRVLIYPVETHNVQDYIFSNCCNYSTTPDQKSLRFESVKQFLMNSSNNLWKGTKMVVDLKWCNYVVVLEDWTSIAQLPDEAIDGLFPKAMCISNMSFPHLAEWFLIHRLCFGEKLLVISSSDSELYKVLKEKSPNCCWKSSTFTLTKEVFERNTTPRRWELTSLVTKDNFCGENYHKCPFFAALLEVGSKTMQATILECSKTS